ncbi:MAG: hypothetical protein ACOYS2_00080 [Patescibacteria group bacterium]
MYKKTMIDFLRKNKVWILTFLYLAGGASLVWFFLWPEALKIRDRADEVERSLIEKQVLEKRLSGLGEMEEKSQNFRANEKRLGKLIRKDQEVEFIKFLEDLGRATGQAVSIKVPEDASLLKNEKSKKASGEAESEGRDILSTVVLENVIIFEITLLGNFPGSVNYIERLENSEYYSNIAAFSMEKIEKEKEAEDKSVFAPPVGNEEPPKEEQLKTVIKLLVYKE